jgi:LemA protein
MIAILLILLACLGVAAAFLLRAYRRLVALDARCEAAAAATEAEILRRRALLPGLVGAIRAFAPQAGDATEAIAKAHAAAQRATTPQARLLAEARLGDALRRLLVSGLNAPQLTGSSEFRELRAVLEETEARLAASRRDLSAAVEAYNRALGRFPASLLALRLPLAKRGFCDNGGECAPRGDGAPAQA